MSSTSFFSYKSGNKNNNDHNNNDDYDSKHLKIFFFSPLPHVLPYLVFATSVYEVDRVQNGGTCFFLGDQNFRVSVW